MISDERKAQIRRDAERLGNWGMCGKPGITGNDVLALLDENADLQERLRRAEAALRFYAKSGVTHLPDNGKLARDTLADRSEPGQHETLYVVPEDATTDDGMQLYSLHRHPPFGADCIACYVPQGTLAALPYASSHRSEPEQGEACPECGGSGMIEWTEERTIPACCGHFNADGSCCGDAVPDVEQEQHQAPCPRCNSQPDEQSDALAALDRLRDNLNMHAVTVDCDECGDRLDVMNKETWHEIDTDLETIRHALSESGRVPVKKCVSRYPCSGPRKNSPASRSIPSPRQTTPHGQGAG